MAGNTDQNLDADYDEYEAMEAEAAGAAVQPLNTAPNSRGRMQPQMNEQDIVDTDEVMEDEIEAAPAPKPVKQRAPHNSNMSARARKPVPVIDPKTGKSTEEELAEIQNEEEQAEQQAEGNTLAAEEKMPRWMPFHQPEKIGIINTQTREIVEGFKDEGSAAGMAKILNEIDLVVVSGGYQ
jgi:hypothetical protein